MKTCYHFAWGGSSGEARNSSEIQLGNVSQSLALLRVCSELGAERFVNASTIMEVEYLESELAASRGENAKSSAGIYGLAKFTTSKILLNSATNLGVDVMLGKITNIFGDGEKTTRFINSMLRQFIEFADDESHQFNFTLGTQNYDFVYVDDAARAFADIGELGVGGRTYTIGSGAPHPLREFVTSMASVAGIAPERLNFGGAAFDGINNPLSAFDITSLQEDTGFAPEVPFAEGIRRTFEWLKAGEPMREVPVLSCGAIGGHNGASGARNDGEGDEAIVTGASGFIGSAVVRELLRRGTKVTALVSPRFKATEGENAGKFRLPLTDPNLRIIPLDMADIGSLPELL
jgi:nucleoside-diphosphate-sugar epimerase